jgi:hypothetical protein
MGKADVVKPINYDSHRVNSTGEIKPTLQYLPQLKYELAMEMLISVDQSIKANKALAKKIPDDIKQEINVVITGFWKRLKAFFDELGGMGVLGYSITRRAKGQKEVSDNLASRKDISNAETLLKRVQEHISLRIIIDDPEAMFSNGDHPNSNFISALAIACYELSKSMKNLKCIVLIKSNFLRMLLNVDEFVNIPLDCRVRLSWTTNELKEVIKARARAAKIDLKEVFQGDPGEALDKLVEDSRSGPRDLLQRLGFQLTDYPGELVTLQSRKKTIEKYSKACFEQIRGSYETQYPGLAHASIILFEGRSAELARSELQTRFDQMLASNSYIYKYRDEKWALDCSQFAELLVEFGLAALKVDSKILLPFDKDYIDEAEKSDAVFLPIPGLRGLSADRARRR